MAAPEHYSTNILKLKFMTRTKLRVDENQEDKEQKSLCAKDLASIDTKKPEIIYIDSYAEVKPYLPCNLSFGGFDPELEKINEENLKGVYAPLIEIKKEEQDMEADVDEEEMIKALSSRKQFKRKSTEQYPSKRIKINLKNEDTY